MQILISCAKTMTDHSPVAVPETHLPHFNHEASLLALQLMQYAVPDLEKLLHVNTQLATENKLRYQRFHGEEAPSLPALLAYTGIVFKRIDPATFSAEDFRYAQRHLFITSFLYGLLRPLDCIKNYRLEGHVTLPEHPSETMFDYWKPRLTRLLIEQVKADDGILVNLASDEMKGLFHWKEVEKEVRLITPEFKVRKNGKLKTIVIYTKMCRGEMTRFLLKNRLSRPEELEAFEWEGFRLDKQQSNEGRLLFTL